MKNKILKIAIFTLLTCTYFYANAGAYKLLTKDESQEYFYGPDNIHGPTNERQIGLYINYIKPTGKTKSVELSYTVNCDANKIIQTSLIEYTEKSLAGIGTEYKKMPDPIVVKPDTVGALIYKAACSAESLARTAQIKKAYTERPTEVTKIVNVPTVEECKKISNPRDQLDCFVLAESRKDLTYREVLSCGVSVDCKSYADVVYKMELAYSILNNSKDPMVIGYKGMCSDAIRTIRSFPPHLQNDPRTFSRQLGGCNTALSYQSTRAYTDKASK